ncbi:MAG: hypothetical protein BGN87_22930 [Rhizobiales bacterium 65-79]|nr:MAG: hypothetical protein BGN87_22930 [Rhizobiales bacterium 65-79]
MLAPVPPVDVGTHTAAIADPAPAMAPGRDYARQASSTRSEMGYPTPELNDIPEVRGQSADDFAGATPEGDEAGIPAQRAPSLPPARHAYEVPSPSSQAVLSDPVLDRQAAPPSGPRYAMLPPARPGYRAAAPRTLSPPEPRDVPDVAPPPSPPAVRDFPGQPETMPADEIALRRELKRLGVRYVDLPPIHERGVCGIDYPVKVLGLSGGIELKPAAVLNARMAATFADYVRKDFAPAVRTRYFSGIETIYTGSTYSCRNMIGESTNHLSEHAKGNALDVMKIRLNSGRVIDVTSPGFFSFRQRGFLNRVRAEACDYFTTVLGPGYNAAHANHFHFDLKQRRNGYVACR